VNSAQTFLRLLSFSFDVSIAVLTESPSLKPFLWPSFLLVDRFLVTRTELGTPEESNAQRDWFSTLIRCLMVEMSAVALKVGTDTLCLTECAD
jgi:hypothetical protein